MDVCPARPADAWVGGYQPSPKANVAPTTNLLKRPAASQGLDGHIDEEHSSSDRDAYASELEEDERQRLPYKGNRRGGRVSHSSVEKRRRDRINLLIDRLAEGVPAACHKPGIQGVRRPKHSVLSDTLALLSELRSALAAGKERIAQLEARAAVHADCATLLLLQRQAEQEQQQSVAERQQPEQGQAQVVFHEQLAAQEQQHAEQVQRQMENQQYLGISADGALYVDCEALHLEQKQTVQTRWQQKQDLGQAEKQLWQVKGVQQQHLEWHSQQVEQQARQQMEQQQVPQKQQAEQQSLGGVAGVATGRYAAGKLSTCVAAANQRSGVVACTPSTPVPLLPPGVGDASLGALRVATASTGPIQVALQQHNSPPAQPVTCPGNAEVHIKATAARRRRAVVRLDVAALRGGDAAAHTQPSIRHCAVTAKRVKEELQAAGSAEASDLPSPKLHDGQDTLVTSVYDAYVPAVRQHHQVHATASGGSGGSGGSELGNFDDLVWVRTAAHQDAETTGQGLGLDSPASRLMFGVSGREVRGSGFDSQGSAVEGLGVSVTCLPCMPPPSAGALAASIAHGSHTPAFGAASPAQVGITELTLCDPSASQLHGSESCTQGVSACGLDVPFDVLSSVCTAWHLPNPSLQYTALCNSGHALLAAESSVAESGAEDVIGPGAALGTGMPEWMELWLCPVDGTDLKLEAGLP